MCASASTKIPQLAGLGMYYTVAALLVVMASLADAVGTSSSSSSRDVPQLQIRRSFYFESHGRDDLREWPSVIFKGAHLIKIDFNFRWNEAECMLQERLPPGYNHSRGCFTLCHYYSNHTHDFNTTFDIVDFISDPSNDYLLDGSHFGPLVFQMCLKNMPGVNSHHLPMWMGLMEEFYAAMNPLLQLPNRRLQFVFDTLPGDDPAMYDHFLGWNSTFTSHNFDAAFNNSRALGNNIFQMVNMEFTNLAWLMLNYGHFYKFQSDQLYPFIAWEPTSQLDVQVFHDMILEFNVTNLKGIVVAFNPDPATFHTFSANTTKRFAHRRFGSLNMTQSVSTPFVIDSGVDDVSTTFIATVAIGPDNLEFTVQQRQPQSTFLAFNTIPLPSPPGAFWKNVSDPSKLFDSVTVSQGSQLCSSNWCTYDLYMWLSSPNGCTAAYRFHMSQGNAEGYNLVRVDPTAEAPIYCPAVHPGATITSTTRMQVTDFYDHGDKDAGTTPPSFRPVQAGKRAEEKAKGKLPSDRRKLRFVPSASGGSPVTQVWSVRLFPTLHYVPLEGDGSIYFHGWVEAAVTFENGTNADLRYALNSSASKVLHHVGAGVTSLSASMAFRTAKDVQGGQEMVGTLGLAWADDSRSVYSASFDFTGKVFQTLHPLCPFEIVQISNVVPALLDATSTSGGEGSTSSSLLERVKLGIGSYPSISLQSQRHAAKEPFALITFGDSFCYNSEMIDDDQGLFLGKKICNLQNATTFEPNKQPVQSYAFGPISAFRKELATQAAAPQRNGFATACSIDVFHGTFDMAHMSSAVLLPKLPGMDPFVQDGGYLAVVSATSLTVAGDTHCYCGTPDPMGGAILLDVFPLLGFYNATEVRHTV